jgi:hypothetical protein
MIFLLSQFLFLLFGLFGLMLWAGSDLPLATREIALNTRRGPDGSKYTLIKVLSVCMKVLAVVLWVWGIVLLVVLNTAGPSFGNMLQLMPKDF